MIALNSIKKSLPLVKEVFTENSLHNLKKGLWASSEMTSNWFDLLLELFLRYINFQVDDMLNKADQNEDGKISIEGKWIWFVLLGILCVKIVK